MADLLPTLTTRAGGQCELCEGRDELSAHQVPPPAEEVDADGAILACAVCRAQLADGATLDSNHWFCLQSSIWSEYPAVQVTSYRLLRRLESEDWAADLLGQVYLEDDVLAWAEQGATGDDSAQPTLDSNGAILADGDAVTLIKDLDVKGTNFVAKRGTMVRNIRLIADDPNNVEGRVNKVALVLKTRFLKKSS